MGRNTRESRDKRCVICGSLKNRQAHHKNSWKYFPLERYDVDNGVTLCGTDKETGVIGCHVIFHTSYKKSYNQKSTKKDFDNFVELLQRIKNKNIIV